MANTHVCGFVAVVGRPNVGKSTLINALVGRKVSIVTPKPQTTRHRILAIHSAPHCQIVFVDTPGIHREAGKAMNRLMNRTAASALSDADLILFVTEANRFTAEDEDVLKRIRQSSVNAIALLNKIDNVVPKDALLQHISDMSKRHSFVELIPISATRRDNLDALLSLIPRYLPVSPPLFPDDMISDRNDEFRAAEIVREKLTLNLRQELPYGLTVQIEQFKRDEGGVTIHAVIWVERDSQKGIVVGKGGSMLKRVGQAARLELREQLAVPVHIELWVRVKENWADSERELARLGFDTSGNSD
ncbi:MAG: GTPase Era [Gammaproteobacteria bacterium]|nr:GTPase Era [Gammaproteobacteria bacterium]MDH4313523.1 GTPase Era [Gammaproteobacteria bacterium]MDH5212592.1 GTPase Era [Gammaproteobacteria bacterium]MDH5500542.1 GTPase Era [Gammaproteobacteria bacterium]